MTNSSIHRTIISALSSAVMESDPKADVRIAFTEACKLRSDATVVQRLRRLHANLSRMSVSQSRSRLRVLFGNGMKPFLRRQGAADTAG